MYDKLSYLGFYFDRKLTYNHKKWSDSRKKVYTYIACIQYPPSPCTKVDFVENKSGKINCTGVPIYTRSHKVAHPINKVLDTMTCLGVSSLSGTWMKLHSSMLGTFFVYTLTLSMPILKKKSLQRFLEKNA